MSNSRSSSNSNNDVDSGNSNVNKNLYRSVTNLNYRPIELTQRVKRIESDDNHYLSSKYKSQLLLVYISLCLYCICRQIT